MPYSCGLGVELRSYAICCHPPFRATSALSVCSARTVLHLRQIEGFREHMDSARIHNTGSNPGFPGVCSFWPVPGPLRRWHSSGRRVGALPASCAKSQLSHRISGTSPWNTKISLQPRRGVRRLDCSEVQISWSLRVDMCVLKKV